MVQTDNPPTGEQYRMMFEAMALHERMSRVGRWVNEGHIEVTAIEKNEPQQYRVDCGGVISYELAKTFPTIELVAKIALAVHAGATGDEIERQQRANGRRVNRANEEALIYGKAIYGGGNFGLVPKGSQSGEALDYSWLDEFSEIKGDVYARVAELTRAAGKAPGPVLGDMLDYRPGKMKVKGLRP